MSWQRPTFLYCDAPGCMCSCWFMPHQLGQKPRPDGSWPFASVPLSRKAAAEKFGWTTRREEIDGQTFTMDYCPEHAD